MVNPTNTTNSTHRVYCGVATMPYNFLSVPISGIFVCSAGLVASVLSGYHSTGDGIPLFSRRSVSNMETNVLHRKLTLPLYTCVTLFTKELKKKNMFS